MPRTKKKRKWSHYSTQATSFSSSFLHNMFSVLWSRWDGKNHIRYLIGRRLRYLSVDQLYIKWRVRWKLSSVVVTMMVPFSSVVHSFDIRATFFESFFFVRVHRWKMRTVAWHPEIPVLLNWGPTLRAWKKGPRLVRISIRGCIGAKTAYASEESVVHRIRIETCIG